MIRTPRRAPSFGSYFRRLFSEPLEARRLLALDSNLIGYWQFDGSGADSSTAQRDVTVAPAAGYAAGLSGQGLDLHHSPNQFASRVGDDAAYDLTGDFTVQVWVKFNNTSGEQTLIEKFTGAGGPGWSLTKLGSNQLRIANADVDTSPLSISSNDWHHVLARHTGSTYTIFFDGLSVASGPGLGPITDSTAPLLIGKRNADDGRDFGVDGTLDEVAIWNRALSDLEVAQLYGNGGGTIITTTAPDRFEPNNSRAAAANVGVGPGVHLQDLTVHASGDDDWYRFELLRPDQINVAIGFTNSLGNLNLAVTDAAGTVLGSSNSTSSDIETVSLGSTLTPLAAGTYYVHVSGASGATNRYGLSIDPAATSSTRVLYVNDGSHSVDFYTSAPGNDANNGLTPATPKASLQSLLADYSVGANDLVVIDTGNYGSSTVLLTGDDGGAAYAGSPAGSNFSYGGSRFELSDSDSNLFYGLSFTGGGGTGFYVHEGVSSPSSNNVFRANKFTGTSTAFDIYKGNGTVIADNIISGAGSYGIRLSGFQSATITGNSISDRTFGLYAGSDSTTTSTLVVGGASQAARNVLSNGTYGIYLDSWITNANVRNNDVSGFSSYGIHTSANGSVIVAGNEVHHNHVGLIGRGTFGGADWSYGEPNDVHHNDTGIQSYGGAAPVKFNRVHDNTVGILAGTSNSIHNNLVYRNTSSAILAEGVHDVDLANNTIYAPAGDGVRVQGGSYNVSLSNSILWTENGYNLYVANNSQSGFDSDYNNLYSTGNGKLVWWQKDFTDLFDWQAEADFDTHSIGRTSLHPTLDNPQFTNLAGDDYRLTAGSTSIDAGNTGSSYIYEPAPHGGQINLGAYGNTPDAEASRVAYIEVDYPNYYSDLQMGVGHPLQWHSFDTTMTDHTLRGAIDIDLYEGANKVLDIAVVQASDASYNWSPPSSINPTNDVTRRFTIRITSLDPFYPTPIVEQSREGFSITSSTSDYYVDDASNSNDEYTPGAIGNNRNTGKTAADPKASLLPLLQAYNLGAGQTVHIDTGDYIHVRSAVISNSPLVGDDEGATFTGPLNSAKIARLDRANAQYASTVIELNDSDFVTLQHLTLQGGSTGLWVHNGSTNFSGQYLTAAFNAFDGMRIENDSAASVVGHLTARDNGRHGIEIQTLIASMSNALVYNNGASGIILGNAGAVQVINNEVYNNGGTGISLSNGNAAVVRNNEVYNNASTGIAISSVGSVSVTKNEVYNNGVGISISASGVPALVGDTDLSALDGNRVYANTSTGIYAYGSVTVAGNTVSGQVNGTGVIVEGGSLATQNVIHSNRTGMVVGNYTSGATGSRNRVYNNSDVGIAIHAFSVITGNVVYSNDVGVQASSSYITFDGTISNNLIYDNSGHGLTLSNGNNAQILNNTIYQTVGDAVRIENASTNVRLRNNVLWVAGGYDLFVSSNSQSGFDSDYNDLYTTGGGRVAYWQGIERPTMIAWQNTAQTDQNSIAQDPLFIVQPDQFGNLVGYVDAVNDGRDDDFHLSSPYGYFQGSGQSPGGGLVPVLDSGTGLPAAATGSYVVNGVSPISPGIDRGDAISQFSAEPSPNGGYVNLGAYGNTAQASKSSLDYVLVTKPDGGEIWPEEQTFPIRWRTPDAGGGTALSFDGVNDYVQVPSSPSLDLTAQATIEAWVRLDTLPSTVGHIMSLIGTSQFANDLDMQIETDNRLRFFVGPGVNVASTTVFQKDVWYHVAATYVANSQIKLYVNGVLENTTNTSVAHNSNSNPWIIGWNSVFGGRYFAGQMDEVRIWNVARSASQLQANMNTPLTGSESGLAAYYSFNEGAGTTAADLTANDNDGSLGAGVPANQPAWVSSRVILSQVDIDLYKGGVFDRSIVDNTPNDGEYLWAIPNTITPDSDYQVRVTRESIHDQSNQDFSIVPPVHVYYVNDGSNLAGDWTSAAGNDANDGLTPSTPKTSVQAVLAAYDLGPGDLIRVDNGSYSLSVNLEITAEDSGVTIEGYHNAAFPTRKAVLDRDNTSGSSYVIELQSASEVTLDYLVITGGYYGIYSNSMGLIVTNSTIFGNTQYGIYLDTLNHGATISGNTLYGLPATPDQEDNQFTGIYARGAQNTFLGNTLYNASVGFELSGFQNTVSQNSVFGHSNTAISINSNGGTVSENTVFNNAGTGIYAYGTLQISSNTVYDNAGTGIYAHGDISVTNNTVYGHLNYAGIVVEQGRAISNVSYGNRHGLVVGGHLYGGTGTNNRAYNNTEYGIIAYSYTNVSGNVVYANATGMIGANSYHNFYGTIANNLIYANATHGLILANAIGGQVTNNTIHQSTGDAIHVQNSTTDVRLRNNILWVESGYDIYVASDSQANFNSDYNNLYTTGTGKLAGWQTTTGVRNFTSQADWFYELGQDRHSTTAAPGFASALAGPDGVLGYSRGNSGLAASYFDNPDLSGSPVLQRLDYRPGFDGTYDPLFGLTDNFSVRWEGFVYIPTTGNYNFYSIADEGLRLYLDNVLVDDRWSTYAGNETSYAANGLTAGWHAIKFETRDFTSYASAYLRWDGPGLSKRLLQGYYLSTTASFPSTPEGNYGQDDSFAVAANSPTIDAGDLLSYYLAEPMPSGGRANLGHTGNTAQAVTSSAQIVQILAPNGLEKFELGQQVSVDWRSAGLATSQTVGLIATGRTQSVENWLANAYQSVAYSASSSSSPINTSGVINPAPEAVYQNFAFSNSNFGDKLAWQLPVPNGNYTVRLHFADPYYNPGVHQFDINFNGVMAENDFDIAAAAGTYNTAVAQSFNVTASGGNGILLELVNQTPGYTAMLSGIEILSANPGGVASPTVDLEYSPNGGGAWFPIADNQPMDRYERGSYAWTIPTNLVPGNDYRVRAIANDGANPVDASDQSFSIANSGTHYYVNDNSTAGDFFTVAVGDNANNGKSPSQPMASLSALLAAYDLDAGDTIHVDTGNYQLLNNIVITSQDSGVRIEGPSNATALLDRRNVIGSSYVLQFQNADNVTIDHLSLTGGYYGILFASGSDSDGVTISNSVIYSNSQAGIRLDSSNDNVTISGNTLYGLPGGATQDDEQFHGIDMANSTGALVSGNTIYTSNTGIYAYGAGGATISNNIVHDNLYTGINAHGDILVSSNTVFGHLSGTGIIVESGARAVGNAVFNNRNGVIVGGFSYGGTATNNRVYNNSETGIIVYSYATASGNTVYANAYGIVGGASHNTFDSTIANNLIYANSIHGLYLSTATNGQVTNNTIYQSVGDAVRLVAGSTNVRLRNNILWVDAGYDIYVSSDSQQVINSDYNNLYTTGTGKIAGWQTTTGVHEFTSQSDWFYALGLDQHSFNTAPGFAAALAGPDGILGYTRGNSGLLASYFDNVDLTGSPVLQQTAYRVGFDGTYDPLLSLPSDNFSVRWQGYVYIPVAGNYTFYTSADDYLRLYLDDTLVVDRWNGYAGPEMSYTASGLSAGWHAIKYEMSDLGGFAFAQLKWEGPGLLKQPLQGYYLSTTANFPSTPEGNYGMDDNFAVAANSPTIDAGDPLSYYLAEPLPNGGRNNLGHTGNTAQAVSSNSQIVQILAPNGLEKFELGQQISIDWRADGLANSRTVGLIATGLSQSVDRWLANAYQTAFYSVSSAGQPIDRSGVSNPAPETVYQNFAYSNYNVGDKIAWQIPLPNGNYSVRLHFAEPGQSPGLRQFDINFNGVTAANDYDVAAAAGGAYRAIAPSFNVTASGGNGILLELVNQSQNYPAIVSGIEILTANPGGVGSPTVDLEYSSNGGTTWFSIADNQPMNSLGIGSYLWTIPTNLTPGNDHRVRAVANDGAQPSDASDRSFSIGGSGTDYYVNDGSTAGDVFTTAVGNDLNTGKSPSQPMASLQALLAAYDLDAGDTIHVDTGNYLLFKNLVIAAQDSGGRIEGPATATAAFTRTNIASWSYAFDLQNADNVTLDHLSITGGHYGINVADNSDSDNLTVSSSTIYGNVQTGIRLGSTNEQALISGNTFYGLPGGPNQDDQSYGIDLSYNNGSLVTGNNIYSSSTGIFAYGTSNSTISNNQVHDNSSFGIYAHGDILVTANTVYGHLTTSGILVEYGARATSNLIYGNLHGMQVGGFSYGGSASGNRVFNNINVGIIAYSYTTVSNNIVYSNSIGILGAASYNSFDGLVSNNLVYANTNEGVFLNYGHNGRVINNTIYQSVGDAIRVENTSGVLIRNNILWVDTGYDIYVDANSQANFSSDYNVFRLGNGVPRIGFWNGDQVTLENWRPASGQDAHSNNADPKLVDINGADDIMGWSPIGPGYNGGYDDNFSLSGISSAIDRAESWSATTTDITGAVRRDDPGTEPNLGGPEYRQVSLGSTPFAMGGDPQNWRWNDTYWNLTLPFSFPLYGKLYTSLYVSSEGYLHFEGPDWPGGSPNTLTELMRNVRIAPLWDNLATSGVNDDIYLDAATPNQITIRWDATNEADGSDVNVSTTLFSDGRIRFNYGAGNTILTPTVGISKGDSIHYLLASYNGQANLTNSNPLEIQVAPGFADIGAYEFLGSSSDTTPPIVTATTPGAIHTGGLLTTAISSFVVTFNEPLNAIDANAPANYQLVRDANTNGTYGDLGDVFYSLTPSYGTGSSLVNVSVNAGVLPTGNYRLTVFGIFDIDNNHSIKDEAGNPLDGDNNGTPSGNYVRTFTLDARPREVTLSIMNPSMAETGGTATVTATLSAPALSDVTISLGLTGSAIKGTDYTISSETIVITTGNTTGSVTLTSLHDLLSEPDESVIVDVTSVMNGTELNTQQVTATVVDDDGFRVTSFLPTSTGFVATFNHQVNVDVLNLYDDDKKLLGGADIVVQGPSGAVRGSLVVDPGLKKITFIASGDTLPTGNYTATLFSGTNALKDTAGNLLDGNHDGVAGDNFTGNITIAAPQPGARKLTIQDFTRGYRQAVNVPANVTSGIPIKLSNGQGVGSVSFTLLYNPQLLTISAATLGAGVNGNLSFNNSTPGVATVTITSTSQLSAGAGELILVNLTAQVPSDAPYTSKHVLDISSLHILDNNTVPVELSAIDNDGIHVAAFFGDANGSQTPNAPDATFTQQLIVDKRTGFIDYLLADPYLIVDINNNGIVQSDDVTAIQKTTVGTGVGEIPPYPIEPAVSVGGPDPLVYIPRNLTGQVGETVTVPVQILVTEPSGVTLESADIAIAYDATKLALSGAELGTLLAGFGFNISSSTPGVVRLSVAGSTALQLPFDASGTLVTLSFTVLSGSGSSSAINLLASAGALQTALYDDAGRPLTLQPAPTNDTDDAVDGLIQILGDQRNSARLTHGVIDSAFSGEDDFLA